MTDTTETADKIRRLTAALERAREDLAFMGRNTLPELHREAEYQREGKRRWRGRAEKAEARVAELETASVVVPAADRAAPAEPVCKFEEGCHRVVACDPGCGAAAADRAALRDRIADALLDHLSRTADVRPGKDGELAFMPEVTDPERMRIADVVLSRLPAPADRAAVLTEVADRYQGFLDNADTSADPRYWTGIRDMVLGLRHIAAECPQCGDTGACNGGPCPLRRVAAETPAAEAPVHAVPVPGSNGISSCCGRPPCEFVGERVTRDPAAVTCRPVVVAQPGKDTETPRCGCKHPADEHSVYGCADGCGCGWMPPRRMPKPS
jgi:hypothetical protein